MTSLQSLSPLLIANRGEIAVRIMQGARELGLETVAVFSEADADAPHVRMADQAVEIGPAEASASYLNQAAILQAAQQSGARALHPGYGFLAENADFAQAVLESGLVWVGPKPEAIRAMGDKAGARAMMEAAGVPVLPGYQGPDDAAALKKAAKQIGFPLLVKAAAGGGGVGMRIVDEAEQLDESIEAARSIAQSAFGDGRLLLEKYLPRAHHVEVQVLGDEQGNLVHLFERECSVQRRHQKIVEESPSPNLDADLRERMGLAALKAAKAVDYSNAGTVEFLLDPAAGEFYFLEMNTRLQVEHPVTEMVTGLDMVEWQLRVAAGEPLDFRQEDLDQTGHAIECRIYAEDATAGFLPQTGRIRVLKLPEGKGLRVDSGVSAGQDVGAHYDPMLAKLIVHAKDRAAAIEKMRGALAQMVVLGLTTNIDFLQFILGQEAFKKGQVDTAWVERELGDWGADVETPPEVLIAAALAALDLETAMPGLDEEMGADRYSPWARGDAFRLGAGA